MVLDMEYREQERPEHGPGGPIFFFSASFVLPAVPASITTGLGLHQKRLLLHEVIGRGIMVCVIFDHYNLLMYALDLFHLDDCLDLTLIHLTTVGVIDGVA
jgi:hypothetical protein